MPTISDLPDEVLELILQHVISAPPLHQAYGTGAHRGDTFHRVADWYTLASVDSRYDFFAAPACLLMAGGMQVMSHTAPTAVVACRE